MISLKRKLGDIRRLRFILGVVAHAGGGILTKRLKLNYVVPLTQRIRGSGKTGDSCLCVEDEATGSLQLSPTVLREVLEKLGSTFVKLGQVLSIRADVVGEAIAQELSKLQSNVPPFGFEEVRDIIRRELGAYPESIYQTIEQTPVAAASLSQVHQAHLKDGTVVAVKVQRPNIVAIVQADIDILRYLARLSEKYFLEVQKYQPSRIVEEFADWTGRELNFLYEGYNADRFRYNFKDNPQINIPKIYWDYSSARVLTMDFMDGSKADDLAGMSQLNIDRKAVALAGVNAVLRQFFIDGFFHADPHPGNFFAMKGNILCLHDFGMVGYLTKTQRVKLVSCFVAFTQKNIEGFTKHFLSLATTTEKSNTASFSKDIATILSEFFFSARSPSIAQAFWRMMNQGAQHNVRFSADLALFGKALVTTEGMGLKIYPEFDFNEQLTPFTQRAFRDPLRPKKLWQELQTDFVDNVEFFKSLPARAQKILTKFEENDVGVKIDATELYEFKREFDRQNDLRILGTVLVAMLLITGVLLHLEGVRTIGGISLSRFGVILSAFLFIGFFLKLRKRPHE